MQKPKAFVSASFFDGKESKEIKIDQLKKKIKITLLCPDKRKIPIEIIATDQSAQKDFPSVSNEPHYNLRKRKAEGIDPIPNKRKKPIEIIASDQSAQPDFPTVSNELPQTETRYTLRKRKDKEIDPIPATKPLRTEIVKDPRPKFRPANIKYLKKNVVVLAWMPTYSPWPARIVSVAKNRAEISFFGDATTGTVKLERIGLIKQNYDLIRHTAQKKIPFYRKAVMEIEQILNIPQHLSLLN